MPPDLALTFYQLLKLNGVYTWESRTCFQYTTTTTEDIEAVIAAFIATHTLSLAPPPLHRPSTKIWGGGNAHTGVSRRQQPR